MTGTGSGRPPQTEAAEITHRRVSIRDVAEAVGVSSTTVSHALNGVAGARVAEDTRARIREAADRLGYTPSRVARSLRLRRTGTLGMLSDHIATTPHAGLIILGAQEAALARGWTLLLVNTGDDPARQAQGVTTLVQHQVDGILYATMYHREVRVPAGLGGLPTVLLDARCADARIPAVVPDEVAGGRAAVDELLRHGHRRIGFALNRDDIPATHGRLRGYRDALAAAGIEHDPRLVVTEESEARGGYLAASRLLDGQPPPTAIFCFNDRMAMGAYRVASERGLAIPRDLSVIGFDNQAIIAEGLYPPLSTVALPHYEMGQWAVETLIHRLEAGGDEQPAAAYPVLMPCPLVVRDSVAPPGG